ncbi:hypothetical protein B1J93_14400 [Leptospira kirschneri serovar Pomona]|uniref:Anti-CBASS protein Acb1-like N-terminal domain-containing protein n=1 Tax=Leptospira kirschneri serovar Pomona TaxID=561005 RepID=A0A1T1DKQ9_9LEPT|nr:anti-CBASS Acb1 family protein [Leptospira kirschneri]OOV41163.1 hypothetical protein B1J93_14400 [Leptospira kirschneri serovar Pomona]
MWNPFVQKKSQFSKPSEIREDSMIHSASGMGTDMDKMLGFTPNEKDELTPKLSLLWWKTLWLSRRIVNCVAEDALRNGFKIETNFDRLENNNESLKNLSTNLSRIIMNRIEELEIKQTLMNALRYKRIYSNGSLIYYIIDSDVPQKSEILKNSIPTDFNKLVSVNAIEAGDFSLQWTSDDPLSADYNKPKFFIRETEINSSRLRWLVKDFSRKNKTGRSDLDDCWEAVKSHNIASWSVSTLLFEMAVKIFKSPEVGKSLSGQKLSEFLQRLKLAVSTQSVMALNTGESFEKKIMQVNGLKEIFDWLTDNVSMASEIPQARLKGAAHGVLASGEYDKQSYFEKVAKEQTNTLDAPLNDTISLIIREKQGPVRMALGSKADSLIPLLDWEVKWNPLWELSPKDQIEIDLKRSQRDQIDIEAGLITAVEARKLNPRFSSLEPLIVGSKF